MARKRPRQPTSHQPPNGTTWAAAWSRWPWGIAVATVLTAVGITLWQPWRPPHPALESPGPTRLAASQPATNRAAGSTATPAVREDTFVADATQQLRRLLQLGRDGAPINLNRLTDVLASDFACAPLRPSQLERVYRDDTVAVQRASPSSLRATATRRGPGAFVDSLSAVYKAMGNATSVDSSVEVYEIEFTQNLTAAKVRIEFNAQPPAQRAQIRADWDCLWTMQDDQLRLSTIRVIDYEEVFVRYPDAAWFVDSTNAVLSQNSSWPAQLIPGLDYWLQRIERVHRMHVFAACGIAVGDADGDGLDDLYVCQPGGLPNRLYLQNLDGTATDVSMRARVDWLDSTSSALWVDLDNDGDQDLIIATLAGIAVMANDGTARFDLVETLPTDGAETQSLSAADYDNDGDLDLYVCLNFPRTTSPTGDRSGTFVYHDANDGAPNCLFRNDFIPDHTWSFSAATQSSGLDIDNRRHSRAAAWEDYDNDGDQDLYVANDYGQNCLYQNTNGKFANVAQRAGVVDFGSGMSVSWGDYNRDGQMDLYVGNMFSSVGGRITSQPHFRPGVDDQTRSILRRFAKGNSLFQHDGRGGFQEVGTAAHVAIARWAWSSLFLDLNNSGWEDVVVANGYITTDDTGDLCNYFWRQVVSQGDGSIDVAESAPREASSDRLGLQRLIRDGRSCNGRQRHCCFLNTGGPRFADISSICDLAIPDDGRAIAASDWDQDGDLDLWIANRNGPQLRFLRNEVPTNHHYLSVSLVGRECNRDAIGARVTLIQRGEGKVRQLRTLRAGDGYLSQSSKALHFGLGTVTQIDRIEVHWPGGEVESFRDLVVDTAYRLTQGTGTAEVLPRGERPINLPPTADAMADQSTPSVLLASRVPLPRLEYLAANGDTRQLPVDMERPLLVNLWVQVERCLAWPSWRNWARATRSCRRRAWICWNCRSIISRRRPARQTSPASSSVNSPFPFASGQATVSLVDKLQIVVDSLFDRHTPLPIPCSILIAEDGQLAAVYKGPLSVDRLLNDVAKLGLDAEQTRMASLPFSGRWLSAAARVGLDADRPITPLVHAESAMKYLRRDFRMGHLLCHRGAGRRRIGVAPFD